MKEPADLSLAFLQYDVYWHDASVNFKKIESALQGMSDTVDLLVLPEMFNTGYTMEPEKVAESIQGKTIQWMQELSEKWNMAVTGSIPFLENGFYYNSFFLVYKNEIYERYDKKYLFSYAGEQKFYKAGNKAVEWLFKGWRIAPFVCYDVRFPVWCRQGARADLNLYIASFPQSRIAAWTTLLKARAIENQSYLIGVNRIGKDGYGTAYNGQSTAIKFDGSYLVPPFETESLKVVKLNKTEQETFRNKFPFRNDDAFLSS